jgi:hemoglobin
MNKEILTIEDIKQLVFSFYDKVREDDILAPIFNERIKDRWPDHLEKMVRFWQTVLLGQHTYQGAPFAPHATLPVEKEHFNHWLDLFYENIDAQFTGEKATEAKWRAAKMAEMFQYKIAYLRANKNTTPII